jgi:hypothetical protein
MSSSRLYLLTGIICLFGCFWIAWHLLDDKRIESKQSFCIIKNVSGIPCPSCGTTRSILYLVHGNLSGAIYTNPLGLISFVIMVLIPFWILYDIIFQKESFYVLYRKIEVFLRKKWLAAILIILILINWFWNIYKGL